LLYLIFYQSLIMHKIYLLLVIVFFSFNEMSAQNHSRALATADTTNFSVNQRNGWQLFNSYVAPVRADSVIIELIVQHDRTIDWKQEHLVGRIKPTNLLPKNSQTLPFNLIYDTYQLRVEPNGKCYLRLAKGAIPDGDPVIIPVRAVYKL
jgi:hypothetical protein